MKIVHTESSLGWGGQEIRIVRESLGLISLGHEVELCCAAGSQFRSRANHYDEQLAITELPISKKSIRGLVAMYGYLSASCPDLVITHSSTDSWLVAISLLFLSDRPKLVRYRHVSAVVHPSLLTRWLYRQPDHIVTTSTDIKRHIESTVGIDSSKVTSIPTGVDLKGVPSREYRERTRKELEIDPHSFVIVMVATLRSWKGHSFVLEAVANLNQHNVKLVIVGDGPQLENLKRQAEESSIQDSVSFIGHVEDVDKYFAAADCFCQPSIRNEGVSQAVLQAFSMKVPVVATAVSGLNEIVKDDETAVVVNPSSASDLTKAFVRIQAGEINSEKMIKSAYQMVKVKHTFYSMLARCNELYRSLGRLEPM